MELTNLSNEALLSELKNLRAEERALTRKLLEHLAELDRRKLYLEYGYSSLFAFTTQYLGYSEPAAQRRMIASAINTKRIRFVFMNSASELKILAGI